MASFNKNEKIGEERLIRLSRRWLITQRKMLGKMEEEKACFLRWKSAQHSSFGRDWLTSFHRDEGADWKVFCRDGFSLNGRRNGSNRGIESRPNLGGCFERLY